MMRELVNLRSERRRLGLYVKRQQGNSGSGRQGMVVSALKGSGVVQELAAALERQNVLDFLPELVIEVGNRVSMPLTPLWDMY